MTPDEKEYLLRMIRGGRNNIMHASGNTWATNNGALYDFCNDREERDKKAREFGTYSNGWFSLDYRERGRWYCRFSARTVLVQGNK